MRTVTLAAMATNGAGPISVAAASTTMSAAALTRKGRMTGLPK